ncbi:hypothetical protein HDF17_003663 [Granulicella arctica]|uniref:DUF4157 domain-containing protein n=1 Tax=Granulicella arctica TaxID=940613 RepID=A0A7Y9TV21_9BACT|nr:hypothetical protein [Granulicella arctica]
MRKSIVCAALAVVATAGVAQQGAGTSAAPTKAETRITKDQAKELFRSVDEILGFVSKDTGLPIEHPVKRKMISREEVNKYLKQKFNEDEGTKRLERSEIVLKKFGLLDRDFHLQSFLVTLLTEQIAGFYDNKTKTVSLLDWIQPEEQKPVLAHELTHALQDQKVGLTKWSDVETPGIARDVQEDNRHIQTDEAETAREAVAEGQAMVSFVDYTLKPAGKTLLDAPELLDRFKDAAADTSGSPVLARAPLLLQESLLFPYSEGLSFEDAVLTKAGRAAAFAGTLENPPSSSFEILHPVAYMSHAPVPVLRLPDLHPLLDAEYTPYDVGVMGELDVRILTELFGGQEMSKAITPAWDGGVYYAVQRKSAVTAEARTSTASLGLLYYARWKSAAAARAFLRMYAAELPRQYSGVVRRDKDEANASEQIYSTNEGDVLLSISGDNVYVGEGFPLALSRTLRDRVAEAQSSGPIEQAAGSPAMMPLHDPALALSRTLSSFGMMKAAMLQRYTFVQRD